MRNNIACYLCGCKKYLVKNGCVRDNALLKIYECIDCGLVFLSSFDHISNGIMKIQGCMAGKLTKKPG